MSIESFTDIYPADETFARDISRWPDFGASSSANFMAGVFLNEGADGISQSFKHLREAAKYGDNTNIQRMTLLRDRNRAAVYLGASVKAMEGILKNSTLDQITFNSQTEFAFSRGLLHPEVFPNPVDEEVDPRRIQAFLGIVRNDKTFGTFFEAGFNNLPYSLARLLRETELAKHPDVVLSFKEYVNLINTAKQGGASNQI